MHQEEINDSAANKQQLNPDKAAAKKRGGRRFAWGFFKLWLLLISKKGGADAHYNTSEHSHKLLTIHCTCTCSLAIVCVELVATFETEKIAT